MICSSRPISQHNPTVHGAARNTIVIVLTILTIHHSYTYYYYSRMRRPLQIYHYIVFIGYTILTAVFYRCYYIVCNYTNKRITITILSMQYIVIIIINYDYYNVDGFHSYRS